MRPLRQQDPEGLTVISFLLLPQGAFKCMTGDCVVIGAGLSSLLACRAPTSYRRPGDGGELPMSGTMKVMVAKDLELGRDQETLGHRSKILGEQGFCRIPNHNLHKCAYFS